MNPMGPYTGATTNSPAFYVGGAHVPMSYYAFAFRQKGVLIPSYPYYFDSPSNSFKACHYSCKSCETSATNCLSCNESDNRYLNNN